MGDVEVEASSGEQVVEWSLFEEVMAAIARGEIVTRQPRGRGLGPRPEGSCWEQG